MLLVVESFEPEYEGDLRIKKDQVVEFLNYGFLEFKFYLN
jgi:hypothetical protein